MTDKELIEGCIRENIIFQEKLYQLYASKMMGVCLRYISNRDEAEDVLQDGFIKIFDKISSFRFDGPLEAWIRKIIVNTAINYLTRNKNRFYMEDIDSLIHDEPHVSEVVSDKLQARDLLNMINLLPPGYKMVFNLFAIEGYGHKEIAEMLGISENTSKTQYMKARKILLNRLEKIKIKND